MACRQSAFSSSVMFFGCISIPKRPLMATSIRYFIAVVRKTVWLGVAEMCEAIAMAGKKYEVPHCM